MEAIAKFILAADEGIMPVGRVGGALHKEAGLAANECPYGRPDQTAAGHGGKEAILAGHSSGMQAQASVRKQPRPDDASISPSLPSPASP